MVFEVPIVFGVSGAPVFPAPMFPWSPCDPGVIVSLATLCPWRPCVSGVPVSFSVPVSLATLCSWRPCILGVPVSLAPLCSWRLCDPGKIVFLGPCAPGVPVYLASGGLSFLASLCQGDLVFLRFPVPLATLCS
jgi:hypothetical protein